MKLNKSLVKWIVIASVAAPMAAMAQEQEKPASSLSEAFDRAAVAPETVNEAGAQRAPTVEELQSIRREAKRAQYELLKSELESEGAIQPEKKEAVGVTREEFEPFKQKFNKLKKVLTQKKVTVAEVAPEDKTVLRVRGSAGAGLSSATGLTMTGSVDGKYKTKLGDNTKFLEDGTPISNGFHGRTYLEAQANIQSGIHASGLLVSAQARAEYLARLDYERDAIAFTGSAAVDVEENHNPVGPQFGSATIGPRGRVSLARDLVTLKMGLGLGEVHTPANHGFGLKALAGLELDVSKALRKVCTGEMECFKFMGEYEFMRNVPTATNIHRFRTGVNVPLTQTTSIEGTLQFTEASLNQDLRKVSDIRGMVTYNGSFDLAQLWDRTQQAREVIEIIEEKEEASSVK